MTKKKTRMGLDEMLALPEVPPEFYVDKFFPKKGVTILAGESGIGKSHILLSALFSIIAGDQAFGCLNTEPTTVQFFTEDDAEVMGPYIRRVIQNHTIETPGLMQFEYEVDTFERLCEQVRDVRPGIIVIDPLVTVMSIDDNREREVYKFVKKLKALVREVNASLVFTRHLSKPAAGVVYTEENIFSRVLGSQSFIAATAQRIVLWRKSLDSFMISVRGKYNPEWHSPITVDTTAGKMLIDVKNGSDERKVRKSKYKDAVLDILSRDEEHYFNPSGVITLISKLKLVSGDVNPDAIRKELSRLAEKGVIIKTPEGKYRHARGIGDLIAHNPRFATPLSVGEVDTTEEDQS